MTVEINHFNPLDHAVCLEIPSLLDETAWAGHTPFAMYLISALRPRTFVELGTYRGVSYCAFCQAVDAVGTDTKCYAIDSWEGDEHAGKLGRQVLNILRSHHDIRYGRFSELLQSTFDSALNRFVDESIDLLHLDGLHTYEAVKHDFETWLPKISSRGVVLFHDIEVRERGFGVWKFWEELTQEYPHFAFRHEHGLGVIAVNEIPNGIRFLFDTDREHQELIRKFFEALGDRIKKIKELGYLKKNEPRVFRAYSILRSERLRSLGRKAAIKLLR